MSLDLDAMDRWLRAPSVVREDGAVLSWVNDAHPGYPYPEIAGLWLSALADADDIAARALRPRVSRWLRAQIGAEGGVGRAGVTYLFDSAVAAVGLRAVDGADALPLTLRGFLARAVGDEAACAPPAAAPRWSESFGPHQIKCVIALRASGLEAPPSLLRLRERVVYSGEGARFTVEPGSPQSYLHAHLYALEGLIALAEEGDRDARHAAQEGARWTAAAQDPSGGLRAWHDGARASGPLRADATAQAVRVWAWADRARYAERIARALGFLAALQHPSGGLRYEPGSEDVNTWATVFARQAAAWSARGPRGLPW